MTSAQAALEELETEYATFVPHEEVDIAIIGGQIPLEIFEAAGLTWRGMRGVPGQTSLSDAYYGSIQDNWGRSLLHLILSHVWPIRCAIVISNEGDASRRLFHFLSEIARTGAASVPDIHFYDVQPQRRPTSVTYNEQVLRRLITATEGWCGQKISEESLSQARNAFMASQHKEWEFLRGRRETPASIPGTLALKIKASHLLLSNSARITLLESLNAPKAFPERPAAKRVFVTGSMLETDGLYIEMQKLGFEVVGENTAWGMAPVTRDETSGFTSANELLELYNNVDNQSSLIPIEVRITNTINSAVQLDADLIVSIVAAGDSSRWDYPSLNRAALAHGIDSALVELPALSATEADETVLGQLLAPLVGTPGV